MRRFVEESRNPKRLSSISSPRMFRLLRGSTGARVPHQPSKATGLAAALLQLRKDRFVQLLVVTTVLGLLWPGPAAREGAFSLSSLTRVGVMLIFFLHGANLAPAVFLSGARRWKVHALIQATTYLAFPLMGAALWFALRSVLSPDLLLGIVYLAALPSTIASAVALTGVARGNVPVAVFNASLSGLLGLVLTPTIVALFAASGSHTLDVGQAVIDIALTILAPFAIGQLARPLVGGVLTKHKVLMTGVDRAVILLIVYASFASSTADGVWSQFGVEQYLSTAGLVVAMLIAALAFTFGLSQASRMSSEDTIAAVFCGSTKSLASGAPMAQILFASYPGAGLIMLPLLMYHSLQLLVGAVIAERFAERQPA